MSFSVRRLVLPAAVTFAIVAAAPFMREIRELFFAAFPGRAAMFLAAGMLAILGALLTIALWRIRQNRLLRYAGLLLVVVLLWLQIKGFSQVDLAASIRAEVNIVERIHIVEYGLLSLLLYRAFYPAGALWSLVLPMLWIAAAGTADESVQWLAPRRTGEFRDVLMNIVAGGTGLLFAVCLWPPGRGTSAQKGRFRDPALQLAGATVLLLGLFIDTAHLGYKIDDPEVGQFHSWRNQAQLAQAAADRAKAWDVPEPPTGQEIWGLQDTYMEEASRHTQHRQESMRDGRLTMAWHANAILERYYAPYLDKRLPSGASHRLRPHARARLEAASAQADPGGYESPVLRQRIWTGPSKTTFRLGVGLVVVLLWLAPRFLRRRPSVAA